MPTKAAVFAATVVLLAACAPKRVAERPTRDLAQELRAIVNKHV